MSREIPRILLLGAAGDPPAWLTEAAPFGSTVACCPTVVECGPLLDRADPIVLLAASRDAARVDTLRLIEATVGQRPHVAIVGLASRTHSQADELLALARAGVHALLFDEDRRWPLVARRAILEAATRCRGRSLWDEVAPHTPVRVRPLVAYGLHHGHESLSVDAAARALGLHRKTLAERCMLSRSLPPQLMLGWCRMMAAAVLLEDRGRLVDHIARELDFASGTAFRNMLKRYTGLNPNELRARGPLAEMTRQFRRAIASGDVVDHTTTGSREPGSRLA
ncbi:MAG: helix-turn-helix transcriptional regulator [Gemmatimonadetes bacterium]|nr:helix-turn-helix transcriptional regulator [Gemmatimonadota bacterium]